MVYSHIYPSISDTMTSHLYKNSNNGLFSFSYFFEILKNIYQLTNAILEKRAKILYDSKFPSTLSVIVGKSLIIAYFKLFPVF